MAETISMLYNKYLECTAVSTDSRADQTNHLFFALHGPNFNGNQFAAQALAKGARYAVVDDPALASDQVIVVPDTLQALQELAQYHRRQLTIPVIGITGSNGKTTTKELIHAVLSQRFNTVYTKGNLNNHIGVPLTLLTIQPEHQIAIIEMGANHIGEIEQLCRIAEPTHGIITNIGKAHLEGFGSLEGVARGKSELYLHLLRNKGTAFINSQNEILQRMGSRLPIKLTYPAPGDFFHCKFISASPFVVYESENNDTITTQIIGEYNFENIAAASCIGKYFNVPLAKINAGIASYVPANNRSQIIKKGTNTILLDAYNANPSSMAASVNNFAQANASHKVVILGDMLELGPESAEEHAKIGKLVANLDFEQVLLCGPEMEHAAAHASGAWHFDNKAELQQWLQDNPVQNSSILIKGSRGMSLETLMDSIDQAG
ncbi:UDP-N-acetylmuramoyl-tripeptide--D-alanyl-D-alanine ligase [Adhaeribacter pallidiroseus]|uniref:UDP-N-acetylmuramoyl-tripeptide--D-alanyl-D-alanine ligase n=1 Tax=Adhaeribacter pallidiroseus TaxID=2072847 RepID=A0A369QI61_9BACT|nr:UDP-N-acetylmuramoyl-tripeptide--D-alanyl-D-alanine ligase [Adhaeribacter pallidiroseus]RDC64581.1 UDP-N-acetylmuramoyl-tripeptide--D-alanyl-D-alanine ligase [Adhaeribacter pallidiroseus]